MPGSGIVVTLVKENTGQVRVTEPLPAMSSKPTTVVPARKQLGTSTGNQKDRPQYSTWPRR